MDGASSNPAAARRADGVRPDVVRLGVILLLSAEAMFFVALAGSFAVLKSAEPAIFAASAAQLDRRLAAIGGICLLLGSACATGAATATARRGAAALLTVLMCLSGGAIAAAAAGLRNHSLGPAGNNFFAVYFFLTSAVVAHLTAGIAIALVLLARTRGATPALALAMRPWTLFWHFATAAGGLLYWLCYAGR
jgi:heme/copper-type cytochrome/quinol oxidase subunit 3